LIVFSIISWFIISHSLSLLILFGHHIFIMLHKHSFTKTCNFYINFLFIFHVSWPFTKWFSNQNFVWISCFMHQWYMSR
jgi:hypothetical protein